MTTRLKRVLLFEDLQRLNRKRKKLEEIENMDQMVSTGLIGSTAYFNWFLDNGLITGKNTLNIYTQFGKPKGHEYSVGMSRVYHGTRSGQIVTRNVYPDDCSAENRDNWVIDSINKAMQEAVNMGLKFVYIQNSNFLIEPVLSIASNILLTHDIRSDKYVKRNRQSNP